MKEVMEGFAKLTCKNGVVTFEACCIGANGAKDQLPNIALGLTAGGGEKRLNLSKFRKGLVSLVFGIIFKL